MNHQWTYLSWTMTLFSSRSAVQLKQTLLHYFPVITVKLLWNNLYCKKCYTNKGDLTWLDKLWLIYLTNHMDNLYDTLVFLFESDSSSAQYESTQNLHQIILILKDMTDFSFFKYTNTIQQKHDTTLRANTTAALSTFTSGCSRKTEPSVNTPD